MNDINVVLSSGRLTVGSGGTQTRWLWVAEHRLCCHIMSCIYGMLWRCCALFAGFFFDLNKHHRNVRWLIGYWNRIPNLEVECTVRCSPVKSFCWWTLQGIVVVGVVGLHCNIYILVSLRLVGAIVNFNHCLQFLLSSICHANCLRVFDGCVFYANSKLLLRSFYYFGTEACGF